MMIYVCDLSNYFFSKESGAEKSLPWALLSRRKLGIKLYPRYQHMTIDP